MNDETLQLILTVLRLMGNYTKPREIEAAYLKAIKDVKEYRKRQVDDPDQDPRRHLSGTT